MCVLAIVGVYLSGEYRNYLNAVTLAAKSQGLTKPKQTPSGGDDLALAGVETYEQKMQEYNDKLD